jgi:dephospho-CoA kinase
MIVLGLTGSIAMGKSTTAAMFAEAGVPVWDADGAVHHAYGPGGAAVQPIGALVPGAAGPGGLDREVLRRAIALDGDLLTKIEGIVHPIVGADRRDFLDAAREEDAPVAVLDIPLLFETGGDAHVDRIVVVTCDPAMQRERALAREGMTPERFDAILARQVPDAEKRARADFIVDTGAGMAAARERVAEILRAVVPAV